MFSLCHKFCALLFLQYMAHHLLITSLWPNNHIWRWRGWRWWSYSEKAAKPVTTVWDCVSTFYGISMFLYVIPQDIIDEKSGHLHRVFCRPKLIFQAKMWSFTGPNQVEFVPSPYWEQSQRQIENVTLKHEICLYHSLYAILLMMSHHLFMHHHSRSDKYGEETPATGQHSVPDYICAFLDLHLTTTYISNSGQLPTWKKLRASGSETEQGKWTP